MTRLGVDDYAVIGAAVARRWGAPEPGAAALARWLDLPYRAGAGGGHDLSGPEFDYPIRQPTRSLVLAATYRSGSTVVAEALYAAGGQGCPLEYFQVPNRYPRFAGPDFRRTVMSHRTDDTGTFGVKIFPPEAGAVPLAGLPDPLVIRVHRRDRVAAAVSTLRALQTARWRSTDPAPTAQPAYDGRRLWQLVGMFENHDQFWQRHQAHLPVIAEIEYDRLRADPPSTIDRVLAILREAGRPADRPAPTPRLVPLSGVDTDPWVLRFTAEYRSGTFDPVMV